MWDWLLQKTQVSFNLYAFISTKFEVDENHCARFDVSTTWTMFKLWCEQGTTEFERSTVIYGPRFFHLNLWPECEARGPWIEVEKTRCPIAYSTDREKEVSEMFIISLANWIELVSTPQGQAVRTLSCIQTANSTNHSPLSTWEIK